MAAIAASGMRPHSVLLLEKNDRVGRKLLSTGNGRCNLLGTRVDASNYHGSGKNTALALLTRMPPAFVMHTFEEMGLVLREEREGRVYPLSGQASSVLDVLRAACDRLAVRTRCGVDAAGIAPMDGRFRIDTKAGDAIFADRVIVAAGGKAAPALGADGAAHALLSSLGHGIAPPFPALSPLKLPAERIRGLKGIRLQAGLTLSAHHKAARREEGEILFTEYGVSGIPAMQLSRFVEKNSSLAIHLLGKEAAEAQIRLRLRLFAGEPMENFFTGLLHKRIGLALLREAGIRPAAPVSEADIGGLLPLLTEWRLPVLGVLPFQHAQSTAGGALLGEFDGQTLASLRVPGLYACGEALDVDGGCGGYNLLWAWVSGIAAGEAAARSLPERAP